MELVLEPLVEFGITKERIEFENFKKPETWLKNCLNKKINLKGFLKLILIAEQEILMMGLRLNKGLDLKTYVKHFK